MDKLGGCPRVGVGRHTHGALLQLQGAEEALILALPVEGAERIAEPALQPLAHPGRLPGVVQPDLDAGDGVA